MKPLIIYHAHCTDGFAAAYAAWLKFGDEAEYIPVNYGEDIQFDFRDRDIYVLDFSYDPERTKFLIEFSSHFTWLDHHKTAFENWAGDERKFYQDETEYTYILLDNNKSGALLAWEYFHPDKQVPMVIRHIDDRDRWKFLLKGSDRIHMALSTQKPWSFPQWSELIDDANYGSLFSEGGTLLNYQKIQVESIVKYARECRLVTPSPGNSFGHDHFLGLAVNTSIHMSEVGHELANKSGAFGLIWYLGEDGIAKCSLRSNGDYDVSAIAKQFGGGGHKNAAGFSVPVTTLLGWLK